MNEAIKEKFCDEYCKMPDNAAGQDELDEICKRCPLNMEGENETRNV